MKPTNGRWVTINGVHVFVKNGQSVEDALNELNKNDTNNLSAKMGSILPGKEKTAKNAKANSLTLSKKEWAMWYAAIGDIERGIWYPRSNDGIMIQIGKKIVFTGGTYVNPKAKKIIEFESENEAEAYMRWKKK